MLTIFTPVYNRSYILPQLYHSLCRQTCKDFEWLIVDDGSTDNIEDLIAAWKKDNKIFLRYIRQPNAGKHIAINRGVTQANGEYFMIVDSDDHLTDDAVDWILNMTEEIDEHKQFAGLSGIRITPQGNKIGGGDNFGQIDANALDIRYKYHINGDLAEVFKIDILRKYKFPSIEGEKFCPEALIWNRIAQQYKLRFCHKGIYVCEYLPDGLTAKITKLRHQSPVASSIYYSEFTRLNVPLSQKIKGAINFWRFYVPESRDKISPLNPLLSLLGFIPGKLMRFNDRRNGQLS